jgi:hypothetical protein
MTDLEFWLAARQAFLTLVDAIERARLDYGQPDPITKRIKPTTGDLRKAWKKRQQVTQ